MTPFIAERRALRFSAISASLFAFTGLALGLATRQVLRNGLDLMGVSAPEEM